MIVQVIIKSLSIEICQIYLADDIRPNGGDKWPIICGWLQDIQLNDVNGYESEENGIGGEHEKGPKNRNIGIKIKNLAKRFNVRENTPNLLFLTANMYSSFGIWQLWLVRKLFRLKAYVSRRINKWN